VPGGAERIAHQLDTLHSHLLVLNAQAWPGQALQIAIEQDHDRLPQAAIAQAALPAVFNVSLRLDLPALGPLEVRLRLAGTALAAQIATTQPTRIAPALTELSSCLSARGLQPAALNVVTPTP
jgi:hypothetical protein